MDPRLGIGIVGIHETIHGSNGLLETRMHQLLLEVKYEVFDSGCSISGVLSHVMPRDAASLGA